MEQNAMFHEIRLCHQLINKAEEVKQSFSCSLNDPTFVKDMRWTTTLENAYVVLSNTGQLYHGRAGFPLKHVMDSVEAVDWCVKGTSVAVARKNVLSILSTKFEEKVLIPLPFRSWIGDSEANVSVKVDSVKCVRPDSIIIGCFQLTEDGKEENYLIQVITSKLGEISDGCSELVIRSFYDIYPGLVDDVVSPGSGPYLLLAYLEQCQLVINANTKNTDKHILLLGWSEDDDKSEAAIVDIDRDKWVPRIGLQENEDDNFLLGLCIDKVSIYQKVGVQFGAVEEKTELLPYCVLMCLTVDGKLVLFHVASLAGSKVSPEVDSVEYNKEDASVKLPVDESSTSSHQFEKKEQELDQDVERENLKSKPFAEDYTKFPEVGSTTNVQSLKSDVLQMVPGVDVKKVKDSQIQCPPGEQQKNLGQKTAALGTSIGSFTGNSHSAAPGLSSFKYSQNNTERAVELQTTSSLQDSQRASHILPGETFSFSKDSNVSSISGSSYVDGSGYQNKKYTLGATSVPGSFNGKPFLVKDANVESPAIYSAANAPGSIVGKPFLVKDVNVESPSIYSASKPFQSGGQLSSKDVNVESPSVYSASKPFQSGGKLGSIGAESSHLSLLGNPTTGKSAIRKFHPSDEQHVNSSKSAISSSDSTKQFGNINEMTKELDLLLKSIEEAGGFRDACTRSLQSSIEEVEQSMNILSTQCKIRTCQVDQHVEEVHFLLNKTIQVVARKVYMEDIYKQACDSRYWDLWNRQKLNSELELKRQHILSLNQDLTYQLVELERHFNALELNKFSQNGGHLIGRGASQNRYGPSRHIQSLHSLQNAIRSQLVAAENLSECLSKQMATLSLRSPSEKQKNVKELFETIGIPYDASYGSPDTKGFMKTPSSKKLLFSDLTTNKDKSQRIQASAMKSCEPETARRRRDSLDQSWTCSEPPKTIIKRMLLQELPKPKWKESSFSKEKIKTSVPVESAPHQMNARIPSGVLPTSEMKASFLDSHLALEEVSEQSKAFIQDGNLKARTQVSDSKSRVLQISNISAVPPRPSFHLSPAIAFGHSTEARDLAAEKSNVKKFDSISNSENKPFSLKEMPQKFSISTRSTTETPSSLIKSSEMPITNSKMTMATSFPMGDKLSGAFTPESWKKNVPSSESHLSSISTASTKVEKVTKFNFDKSWPDNNNPALPKFSGLRESPLSPTNLTPSISSASSSVSSVAVPPAAVSVTLSNTTSSKISVDSNHMTTSSASGLLSLSNQAPKQTSSPLPNPPSFNTTSESHKSEIQPASGPNLKTNLDAAAEVVTQPNKSLNGESEMKLGSSRNFSPSIEQPANNIKSSDTNIVSVSQSEQPSDTPPQLSTSFLTSTSVSSGKNGGLDVGISQEDEMEEEAPETSNSTELSLGSLGGFGIGSTPNPSIPKSNPFGGSFNNVATSLSSPQSNPVALSVPSGELFRPASFTFPSSQSSVPTQSTNSGAFSGGFGVGAAVPAQAPSAFGQPAQIGGSGQQVLGSVLGSFGQSRQLGGALPGSGFAAPTGFGGGFATSSNTSGFSNAAVGGGFAGRTSTVGGFAAIASTGGGFASVTSTGSGFSGFASPVGGFAGAAAPSGGGFAGAAAPSGGGFAAAANSSGGFAGAGSGGGFGAFSSQGSGGFSAFSNVGGNKPPELFTQMRK
ncbi:nuclear pore complex protein NUP214 isoform X2 [Cicer arietinum]|uniref:Nuclear pore complex protein NUP214 isoform X2 n=1 Tax=Cicer arietinum TaxID=3827 RepID=A0A3Q7XPC0_CICAR|nr:nuclear pore complex protein NUP214 isoform X2 [Cicer arietinum]